METADQTSGSLERCVAEAGIELVGYLALEVAENLATLVVDAEIARRQRHAEFFEPS
jgi:hypothetical protein